MKEEQHITIDEFAAMMNRSFEVLTEKIEDVKDEIKGVKDRLGMVEDRLGTVEDSLERIENKVENRHETRITKLEDDMRIVKTALGK